MFNIMLYLVNILLSKTQSINTVVTKELNSWSVHEMEADYDYNILRVLTYLCRLKIFTTIFKLL